MVRLQTKHVEDSLQSGKMDGGRGRGWNGSIFVGVGGKFVFSNGRKSLMVIYHSTPSRWGILRVRVLKKEGWFFFRQFNSHEVPMDGNLFPPFSLNLLLVMLEKYGWNRNTTPRY